MTLPFDLPAISRGFADLRPATRRAGEDAAAAAARALSSLLGEPVELTARAVPGPPAPRALAARVAIELAALPGAAVLEVDPALVVRTVDRLAGGPGAAAPASRLTPVEATLLELATLAALDGASPVAGIETALAPRLARGGPEPVSPLAIELDVTVGPARGRARLLLPAAALRALAPDGPLPDTGAAVPLSWRRGATPVSIEELEALAPGDVLLVDPPDDGRDALVLPGGARLTGRAAEDGFHVEEIVMGTRTLELPVVIEVELARVEVTLADLARLEPGAALPLALDRRGLVTLRVGDRAVARGELVDVEGAVGVRVTAVEAAP